MPYVTISPIPHLGGSISGFGQRGICRLTENRFFGIYHQSGPDYTFGMVFSVDNPKAASPIATLHRTQVLPALGLNVSTGFRCARLNDTDVFVAMATSATNIAYRVLRIDPVTNEISSVGNTINETTLSNAAYFWSSQYGAHIRAVAENIVWAGAASAGTVVSTAKFSWNPGTLALTRAAFANISTGTQSRMVQTLKNRDGGYTITGTSHSSNYGWQSTVNARLTGDADAVSLGSRSVTATDGFMPVCLGTEGQNALWLKDPRTWRAYTPSAATTDVLLTTTALPANNWLLWATWLNQDHFMIISTTVASPNSWAAWPSATSLNLRVVKYTDPTYGQTSPTTTPNLTRFSDIVVESSHIATGAFELVNDVVYIYGRSSTTNAFRIGFITPQQV